MADWSKKQTEQGRIVRRALAEAVDPLIEPCSILAIDIMAAIDADGIAMPVQVRFGPQELLAFLNIVRGAETTDNMMIDIETPRTN